jgi:AcrR family transcriptional regulator
MARWEPDARARFVTAAIEQFAQRGYDKTSVAEIADHAGLTKTTFFRHFRDKREVLFAGQETHATVLTTAIAGSTGPASPLGLAASAVRALAATAAFTEDRRPRHAQLQAIIASNVELQERADFKGTRLVQAIAVALRQRGVPEPTATLAADIGIRAFHTAYEKWIEPGGEDGLVDLVIDAVRRTRLAVAGLDLPVDAGSEVS